MSELDVFLRLLTATACGAIIGAERERGDRPAGLKTYILVAIGACLFTELSLIAFPGDPARVAAQVVVGIGFLGAGVIVVYGGTHVVGITTAAAMWATAALGMMAGLGYYLTAAYSTAIIMAVLVALPWFEGRVIGKIRKRRLYFTIRGAPRPGFLEEVGAVFAEYGAGTSLLRYHFCETETQECSIMLKADISSSVNLETLMNRLYSVSGVTFVGFEE